LSLPGECISLHFESREVDKARLMDQRKPNAVLIVEDEALLRLHAIMIVEQAGFVPIAAYDADEAIAILGGRSDIVLLFTDIHMPGSLDGLKLAHIVRDRWPPIKIIVVSGRTTLSKDELPPGGKFFAKPFETGRMISEMRSMIAT
jgi:two-component system, response regulator PdtaR